MHQKLVGALWIATCLAACGGENAAWDPTLAPTSELYAPRRGLRVARGPIHLHSPYSHDACDKLGYVDGVLNQACLDDLRTGLCKTHQDFAMLTDHADFFSAADWDAAFLPAPGDEAVMVDGQHIASRLHCPDGTTVMLMVGSENELMPLGLHEHVADTVDERRKILQGTDGATAKVLRSHGALIAIAHGEAHDYAQLIEVEPDALEIYNIHANLGPDIRLSMGLDPLAPILAVLPFINMDQPDLIADLAFLVFWEENAYEIGRLDSMWSAGYHVTATLGVDAHENTIPGMFGDGERGDSYRRLLRWFSNHLLVTDVSPTAVTDAIKRGRAYGVFEVFGAPTGFDFRAEAAGTIAEIGDTVPLAAQEDLIIEPPNVSGVAPQDLRLRMLRIDASGSQEIAVGSGAQPLHVRADRPGAYRAEVRIRPRALRKYLGTLGSYADNEFVWIYSSPIYVE